MHPFDLSIRFSILRTVANNMTIAITTGLIAFVAVALLLLIARRALRIAVKLALVGVLVVLLIAGASVGWWRGWFGSASRTEKKSTPTNQRTNSNRKPAR